MIGKISSFSSSSFFGNLVDYSLMRRENCQREMPFFFFYKFLVRDFVGSVFFNKKPTTSGLIFLAHF